MAISFGQVGIAISKLSHAREAKKVVVVIINLMENPSHFVVASVLLLDNFIAEPHKQDADNHGQHPVRHYGSPVSVINNDFGKNWRQA